MKISKIYGLYFSPCKSTKLVITAIAETLGGVLRIKPSYIDFTSFEARKKSHDFSDKALVIIGTPVFAGRIPNKIMPYIDEMLHGCNTPAIGVVTYGNRSFDNALSEMDYLLTKNGFVLSSAAAVISEHSMVRDLAANRPNSKDVTDICEFASNAAIKLMKTPDIASLVPAKVPGENPPTYYYTPLQADGTPAKFLKATPKTDMSICNHCGVCANVCPMGSVDNVNPDVTKGICIKCHACIKYCRVKARYFDDPQLLSHHQMLRENFSERKESSFFVD